MSAKLIGGMFGLGAYSKPAKAPPPFLTGTELLLTNARSGMHLLASLLRPSRIWMPSFLCDVMIDAARGFDVQFYEVTARLHATRSWIEDVHENDLVVLLDYFGFPCDRSVAVSIKQRGGWVLEDASQALLSLDVGACADYVLFSPRKYFGIPDGGILRNNTTVPLPERHLKRPPVDWWLKAFHSTILRREFDLYGGERSWYQLFTETERDGPIGAYRMSELSRTLLEYSFDSSEIARRRVENYETLNVYLSQLALFPDLPSGVIPLGYPICVNNRDQVRRRLFDNNIYPPIHWPIDAVVPETFTDSHRLAGTILTLVCDQRYDSDDMERTARIVLAESRG